VRSPKLLALSMVAALLAPRPSRAAPPVYIWVEADWFHGVQGMLPYWTGAAKPTGHFAIAGPGISAEWSQGGESEWNSMGAPAEETNALAWRSVDVPRAGRYRLWVRYVDHRNKREPFTVTVEQGDRTVMSRELGVDPVVPPNDEYELYWGFSFGWGAIEGDLAAGPARISLRIDKPGEAWRQLDTVLLTDDRTYQPVAREKPPFGYLDGFRLQPGEPLRGSGLPAVGEGWKRPKLGGEDFTMWAAADPALTAGKDPLSLYDLFFRSATFPELKDAFAQQFAGRKDVPIVSWPRLRPVFHLNGVELQPGTPLRAWLERVKIPFAILTNYSQKKYTPASGPGTFAALHDLFKQQFLGFIHGESVASPGVGIPDGPRAPTRRGHVDAMGTELVKAQAEAWTARFLTPVPDDFWSRGISCLSSDLGNALAHELREVGARVVGYEEDATEVHVPLRLAFQRGAARQYGGTFINYASGNFGDACNYFSTNPVVNRGAGGWFHSKYAVTDGVTIGWYRKLYYLNYLGGASAIFWEQGLDNQWIKPGPGNHPIELSPFGRATVDFQQFADRVSDRGEPYTPIALLLSHGHGYERVSFRSRMLDVFEEEPADLELRELLNVLYHPTGVLEGQPASPDVQSLPSGVYGNIFDVLVDRPARARALLDYPIVWAAGDVRLDGALLPVVQEHLRRGGTLVLNASTLAQLPAALTGVRPTGAVTRCEGWRAGTSGEVLATTPYPLATVQLAGAQVLATNESGAPLVVRQAVGKGAVVTLLVPRGIGLDERAHPALPFVMNGLTEGLLPIEVKVNGARPAGEIMYQLNRTRNGWLVLLVNNRGVDKTQSGIARVDRRAFTDVTLRTRLPIKSARELSQPREVSLHRQGAASELQVRVEPGDLQVIELLTH
jgi:hypothetical protein